VVKFEWDHKYYCGNLVAVHPSLDFVAYALKGCFHWPSICRHIESCLARTFPLHFRLHAIRNDWRRLLVILV